MRGGRARGALLGTAAVVALAVGGCSLPSTGAGLGSSPSAAPGDTAAAGGDEATAKSGTALATLKTLRVHAAGSQQGYTRDEFGPAWADVNHNGCDTRNDVLARDMRLETFRASGAKHCVVLTGNLHDPYTGRTIHFTKSKATRIQIDHVVALSAAWKTGASAWSTAQRERLANDPANLLAVDGPSNEAKGDSDASQWLPPEKSYRCAYVARQIGVKAKYKLWVTPAERDAMRSVLSSCPTQRTLSSG